MRILEEAIGARAEEEDEACLDTCPNHDSDVTVGEKRRLWRLWRLRVETEAAFPHCMPCSVPIPVLTFHPHFPSSGFSAC